MLIGKVGRRTLRLTELKKGTNKVTQPNATSPSKAFQARSRPSSCDCTASNLAKDIRVGLDCVESAGVVIVGELGGPIRVVKSPSRFRFSLIAQPGTGWFPRFVESLKVEDVLIPAKQSAYALLEEGVSLVDAVYSAPVAGSG